MISAALVSSRWVLRIRDCRTSSGVSPCPATRGMTATPVSKPERPSASLGNSTTAITIHSMGRLSWANRLVRQLARIEGSLAIVTSSHRTTVTLTARNTATRPTASQIASLKPFRKIAPSRATSSARQDDRMVNPVRNERVLDDVGRGVGGRHRDRDDEARCRKPEKAEDDRLPAPPGQPIFEDRQAALAVRAQRRHAPVHRQRAEERESDEDNRREWREIAGREERDARLVAQGREVVDASEAHDLPPARGVSHPSRLPAGLVGDSCQKPRAQAGARGRSISVHRGQFTP